MHLQKAIHSVKYFCIFQFHFFGPNILDLHFERLLLDQELDDRVMILFESKEDWSLTYYRVEQVDVGSVLNQNLYDPQAFGEDGQGEWSWTTRFGSINIFHNVKQLWWRSILRVVKESALEGFYQNCFNPFLEFLMDTTMESVTFIRCALTHIYNAMVYNFSFLHLLKQLMHGPQMRAIACVPKHI